MFDMKINLPLMTSLTWKKEKELWVSVYK